MRRDGFRSWSILAAAFWAVSAGPSFAQDGAPFLDIKGLLDGRLILTDDTVSWENERLGKTRYGAKDGGDRRFIASFAEASLILEPHFGWDTTGFIHVIANDQQDNAVDIVEALVSYKPAPKGPFSFSARAGAFFPPISLENTGLAWSSPYTISSSAINSWVGEELKTIGPEITGTFRGPSLTLSLLASIYYGNDPAGTLIAWRGWALHDHKAGLFEKLKLAPIRVIQPTAPRPIEQAPFDQPVDEIDNRAGYYVGLHAQNRLGEFQMLWYDNNADDLDLNKKLQWAWRTKFVSLGLKTEWQGIDLIGQYMKGTTSIITLPPPTGPIVKSAYDSAFLLASKAWGRNRLSVRAEYFDTHDRESTARDNNDESGTAYTLAYVFRPFEMQRLTLELLHIRSTRPERTLSFQLPTKVGETEFQISYRFFF